MKIDDKLLTKLENLSRLNISDDKREEIKQDLTNILDFVDNLNELDLKNKDSSFQTSVKSLKFREDKPEKSEEIIKEILKYAPDVEGSSFVVPKIIE